MDNMSQKEIDNLLIDLNKSIDNPTSAPNINLNSFEPAYREQPVKRTVKYIDLLPTWNDFKSIQITCPDCGNKYMNKHTLHKSKSKVLFLECDNCWRTIPYRTFHK